MPTTTNEDIYKYQFDSLFRLLNTSQFIGNSAIIEDNDEEDYGYVPSDLLFDIRGVDFDQLKGRETEYRGYVEIYVLKIIENLLTRKKIDFEERYYGDGNEQHSIVLEINGKKVEAYFLFDITYGEDESTNYDAIGKYLRTRAGASIEKINLYIFRDRISPIDLASMFNWEEKKKDNGFVTAYPLKEFFDVVFDHDEYLSFCKYAEEFHERCNSILSYKTVIKPTKRTLASFKKRKEKMLANLDYKSLAEPQIIRYLKTSELSKIQRQFSSKKMYQAMVGDNDYAQSFMSAEWSYDVYANAMGDLDLTGIISGYLKSIEQLLYEIVKFHKGEGRKIDANGHRGKVEYTTEIKDNEIDTTLHSLKNFLTSYDNKLALDGSIRQTLNEAIRIWTTYQRNGYFHKHNLYKDDNKIDDVRNQTIFLYFLILGGFQFNDSEINMLKKKQVADSHNVGLTYDMLENWMSDIFKYDLPQNIPGILILLTRKDGTQEWRISPYLLNEFDINNYKNNVWSCTDYNHVHDISELLWSDSSLDIDSAAKQFEDCLSEYWYLHRKESQRIKAVVFGYKGDSVELIHYVPD